LDENYMQEEEEEEEEELCTKFCMRGSSWRSDQ
jgi:hypothetical protein